MDKKSRRLKRAKRVRCHLKVLGVPRLTVHRSSRHIHAQVIEPVSGRVISAASTLEQGVRTTLEGVSTGCQDAARSVGRLVAERCLEKLVKRVGFDRSGFRYHGRVAALADAARESGLEF